MPLFRTQVICSTVMSSNGFVDHGSMVVSGNTTLGDNLSSDEIFLWGVLLDKSRKGATYVDSKRRFVLPDAYYQMDPADIHDIYETAFSAGSTSFELGNTADFAGLHVFFINRSVSPIPIIMNGSTLTTLTANTSILIYCLESTQWLITMRGAAL